MAKSNAQRQSEYRHRQLKDENGEAQRLNLLLSVHAKRALERLSACYAVTRREVLEGLLRDAENAAIDRALMVPMARPTTTSDAFDWPTKPLRSNAARTSQQGKNNSARCHALRQKHATACALDRCAAGTPNHDIKPLLRNAQQEDHHGKKQCTTAVGVSTSAIKR